LSAQSDNRGAIGYVHTRNIASIELERLREYWGEVQRRFSADVFNRSELCGKLWAALNVTISCSRWAASAPIASAISNKASACVEGASMWNSAVSSTVILKSSSKVTATCCSALWPSCARLTVSPSASA